MYPKGLFFLCSFVPFHCFPLCTNGQGCCASYMPHTSWVDTAIADQLINGFLQFLCAYASCIRPSTRKKYVCLADTAASLSCTHPLAPFEIQNISRFFILALIRDLISSTNCIRWRDETVCWPIINSVHSYFITWLLKEQKDRLRTNLLTYDNGGGSSRILTNQLTFLLAKLGHWELG